MSTTAQQLIALSNSAYKHDPVVFWLAATLLSTTVHYA